jgi:deoxyguanosine kinase
MIISIEGNIGSGKSTLVKILKEKLKDNNNFVFIPEPVDEWMNMKNNNNNKEDKEDNQDNILTKFYKNQEKYSFIFQVMSFTSKLKLIKKAITNNPNKIIITERSVHTDKEVFAKLLYDDEKMEDVCYKIYQNLFEEFLEKDRDINKIIYVKTNPDICHNRVNKRKREGESLIEIEYLKKCDLYHEKWLNNKDKDKEVLILDGNNEFENDENIVDDWVKKIVDYCDNNKNENKKSKNLLLNIFSYFITK